MLQHAHGCTPQAHCKISIRSDISILTLLTHDVTSHSAAFRIVFPMRQSIIFMIALAILLVFIRILRGDAVVIAVMDAVPVQLV